MLLFAINLDLDFDIRYIANAVMDDVTVWDEFVVFILEMIYIYVLEKYPNFEISKF